jgi:hypothetical protein
MTKYISFSVYGGNPLYLTGSLENAELIKAFYPDWKAVFYVDKGAGQDFNEALCDLGAQVVIRDLQENPHGMFWRFEAVKLADAEVVLFRDTDSRLSQREYLAVREWEATDFDLHVMRDHPFHCFWILGGMWGAKGDLLRRIGQALPQSIPEAPRWGLDQQWLARNVYRPNLNNALIHDPIFNRDKSSLFPSPRVQGEYVGESVDEFGGFSVDLRKLAIRADNNPMYVRKLRARDWLRVRMEQSF